MHENAVPLDPFVSTIRTWWSSEARELPWRSVRDPWAIHLSEVMAQQTQLDRVVPKWKQFLERFPTVEAASRARAGELIELWDGLGYNRRALLLHRCAQEIVATYGGKYPRSLDELLALPGIGPYTARAIQAFAFELDVAVLDTNVGRVLARLTGKSLTASNAQALADSLVPAGAGWEWNQALLDFGAMVCTKRTPGCVTCPARAICTWHGVGVDPAEGSAGVSVRQSAFEGSDRQARGRLIIHLRQGSVTRSEAIELIDLTEEPDRAEQIIGSLESDGMVIEHQGRLQLP